MLPTPDLLPPGKSFLFACLSFLPISLRLGRRLCLKSNSSTYTQTKHYSFMGLDSPLLKNHGYDHPLDFDSTARAAALKLRLATTSLFSSGSSVPVLPAAAGALHTIFPTQTSRARSCWRHILTRRRRLCAVRFDPTADARLPGTLALVSALFTMPLHSRIRSGAAQICWVPARALKFQTLLVCTQAVRSAWGVCGCCSGLTCPGAGSPPPDTGTVTCAPFLLQAIQNACLEELLCILGKEGDLGSQCLCQEGYSVISLQALYATSLKSVAHVGQPSVSPSTHPSNACFLA